MSDTKNTDEPKSLSLSRPRRLELKKTVETGQVRQSFSHGRSKTVQVEVRKKRTFTRDGDKLVKADPMKAPAETAKEAPAATPAPAEPEKAEEPEGSPKARVVLRQLTDDEKAARARALKGAKQAADEARRVAEIEAKARAEEEEKRRVEEAAAAKRAEEEAARKQAEEEARQKAEEDIARRALADAAKKETAPAEPAAAEEEEAPRAKRPGKGAAPKPTPTRRQPSDRRRGGKLTISRALEGEDGERQHSLAALRRRQEREKRAQQQRLASEPPKRVIRDVVIPESITVGELANRMAERASDVVKALMKMGVMANASQVIDADTAELVVSEFGHRLTRVSEADVEIGLIAADEPDDAQMLPRAPVVTVMGHVDHGKTSLLDALRKTDVAGREAGGITQHIGAYQVQVESGQKITFIDTPGHEAFTEMRARGATVTDIVVLVVAADDSVMPQTIEAVRHAKAAEVPIIVAINKCDKPDANPDRVRQDLLQHEVIDESMGGDVLSVEVSAIAGTNLDKLTETILLQSELLELKANPDRAANGTVVEAKLEQGRGTVATVLVQAGTLRVGDIFVAGAEWGRVRALIDDHGKNVKEAGPSVPVEVLGLQGTPNAGEEFAVVDSEARAREVAEFRTRRNRDARTSVAARGTLEQMMSAIQEGKAHELPVVIKADVQGSLEAIIGSVNKMATDEVKARVLHSAVGGIAESDVSLAKASNATIFGFNVRANKQARDLAQQEGVDIRYYTVIYDLTEDFKKLLSGMLAPEVKENTLGSLEIREVFNITKVGKVAGCMVTEGMVRRGARFRLLRDNVIVHEGKLATLRRFKDDVREVKEGTECGIALENYQDIQVGDVLETFELEEIARTL
ncbi:MAG: translation initiation factor IF-2 [Minwuiales bacterium]|nr:translation initiation factor IF-2 [Minwuiales bacterium]